MGRRMVQKFMRKFFLPLAGLALDAALVAAAFYGAFLLRFYFAPLSGLFPPPPVMQTFSVYAELLPMVIPLWLLIFFYSARLYSDPHLPPEDVAVRCIQGVTLATLLTFAISFMLKQYGNSRLMLAFVLPVAFVLVFAGNMLLRRLQAFLLAHCGMKMRVLVAGTGKAAELAKLRLSMAPWRQCDSCAGTSAEDILDFARANGVQHVILANASLDQTSLLHLADALDLEGVKISIMPGMMELRTGEVQLDASLGLPVMTLHHTSLTSSNYVSKRLFDVAFSLFIIIVGLIPFLIIAMLIKLDSSGPILYRQKRYGYKGSVFGVYKFRTMYSDAEARLKQLQAKTESSGPYFKMKDDPRITPVGKWLRRLSLDEFPQFINVLLGEMSVVGPRPLAVSSGEKEALESEYGDTALKVFNVLPGITGLWQVSGRSDLQDDQRFTLDMYYIERWTLGLDLKIILKTPLAMLSIRGAY